MRNLLRNAIIVLVAVLLAVWAVVPPSKTLRLGRDLRGGVSLVYAVNTGSAVNKNETIGRVIEVLKERLDPNGLLEISIRAIGTDRIEISMPLPTQGVQDLRTAFETELAALGAAGVTRDDLEQMVRAAPDQRDAQIARLAGDDPEKFADYEMLAELYDAMTELSNAVRSQISRIDAERLKIDALVEQGVGDDLLQGPRDVLQALEDEFDAEAAEAADAQIAFESERDALLEESIAVEDVRRAVGLSTEDFRLLDDETDEIQILPGARARAITSLKDRFPNNAEGIDTVVNTWKTYEENRRTLDDPNDIKRLVRNAGVLNFRITVEPTESFVGELRDKLREQGPSNASSDQAAWFKVNKLRGWVKSVQDLEALRANPALFFSARGYTAEEYNGEYFMLCWDVKGMRLTGTDGAWRLASAYQTLDRYQRQAIGFRMDARGGRLLGQLTDPNQGRQMAILLDDEVYTAPNLNAKITTSGIIEGEFTQSEVDYIIRVLSAGSLQAKLSRDPISENTLAPTMGEDNLRQGRAAGIVALISVSSFMVFYYFFGGGVAVISLFLNALFILAAMALQKAAFTLPGIAGVILTFGMAVDANVLIYERIREELKAGADLRTSVRLGYQRALSSIVDGNVTNLIVCIVLGFFGTPEIKGFAITLGIGVVSTLFTALFISRLIFSYAVDERRARVFPGQMLPLVIPAIDRILTPNIDWLGLRNIFRVLSVAVLVVGMSVVVKQFRAGELLGTEFTGGVEVTLSFSGDGDDKKTLTRAEVKDRIDQIAQSNEDSPLKQLEKAEVVAVNPEGDGITSGTFKIRTTLEDTASLLAQLTTTFSDVLDQAPPLTFSGADGNVNELAVPVTDRQLGRNINRPGATQNVSDFQGGVAIILDNLQPRPSLESLRERLAFVRAQEDFADTLVRSDEVIVVAGTENAVESAVYVVHDDRFDYFNREDQWRREVQGREWELVTEALRRTKTLASVQQFSAAIARTFVAQAVIVCLISIVLIIVYVWVRFGSIRYSLAAIATTIHDILIVLGLVAIAEIVYNQAPGIAQALLLQPFKLDLTLIAAMLTVLGYSLNDTIIVMDRIRENRGKLPYASRQVVNTSINQTISRTVITSGTTLIATLILYIIGGEGIREFAFALLIGVVVGTYSSIAIASPFVWSHKHDRSLARQEAEEALAAEGEGGSAEA